MDKIISFFSSTRLMAVLFLVFAFAMGLGTFIEDAYNTDTARIYIYNAWWFEAIMLLFVVNFIGNIKRYQLHKKEKWATLLLHLSFIFIITGAFVTRYISFEGMMPIREGATESRFYSDKTYLTAFVDGQYKGEMRRRTFEEKLLLSPVTNNHFSISNEFNEIPFEIEYKDFKLGAKETIVKDPKGIYYLKMVEAGDGGRHEHYLKEGQVENIHNILFAFNAPTEGAINITIKDGNYTIKTPFEGDFMRMADQFKGSVTKDSEQPLMFRSLYNVANARFVFPEAAIKGKVDYVSNNDYKTKEDAALTVVVKAEGEEHEVTLLGGKAKMGVPQSFKLGSLEYTLIYGSKQYDLPFSIRENDFIAKKHPGTESSYESFESKVTVEDKEKNNTFDARIYMNNVLDYRGYRFFQASFDADEKGTVLSVNHDFWGTWISYIGYFLLYIGLMAILFDKNTRFGDLKRKLDKVAAKKAILSVVVFLFLSIGAYAQGDRHMHEKPTQAQMDSLIMKFKVSEEHAAKFGRLIIQDAGGRMKPINTFSSELLRKVSKSDTYKGLNADQVFLSMAMMDQMWFSVPIIKLNTKNDSLKIVAGLDKKVEFASLADFFDAQGNYKLSRILEKAYREQTPNKFQTDYIEIDKRVNLLYSALTGQILKVYPVPGDKNNKWLSYLEIPQIKNANLDSIKNVLPFYMQALGKATQDNDYKLANSLLEGLTKYQHRYGSSIMPSDDKVNAEILYNKYDIFKKLFSWYLYAGLLMFLFAIVKIFNSKKWVGITLNVLRWVIGFLFVLHTVGLIVRWYVSGHAPWSNAYESVIYVAWATMFFGLAFGFGYRLNITFYLLSKLSFVKPKSELTVASTAFVASMVLMVAHWNWTDPEIGNLVPVLNSYWLMIHVAVIVGSYGPFTLATILGLVALLLMIFTNSKNKAKMELHIKELTYVNEMALTIGLVMLSIGNFLGGQWANESWGRYWGWDPKETWALVSIMVYAFVIHMRFVPALRGKWIYNFFSVLAFASILMTYFGVNFYLTGLHSYASGEVRTPMYFLWMAIGVFILGGLSYLQYKKHLKK
jgi:cytochrome c-type biogenesis protein CcsB